MKAELKKLISRIYQFDRGCAKFQPITVDTGKLSIALKVSGTLSYNDDGLFEYEVQEVTHNDHFSSLICEHGDLESLIYDYWDCEKNEFTKAIQEIQAAFDAFVNEHNVDPNVLWEAYCDAVRVKYFDSSVGDIWKYFSEDFFDKTTQEPKPQPIVIPLNSNYEAVLTVGEDHVVVGCQTFKKSRILELAEKIKELDKQ